MVNVLTPNRHKHKSQKEIQHWVHCLCVYGWHYQFLQVPSRSFSTCPQGPLMVENEQNVNLACGFSHIQYRWIQTAFLYLPLHPDVTSGEEPVDSCQCYYSCDCDRLILNISHHLYLSSLYWSPTVLSLWANVLQQCALMCMQCLTCYAATVYIISICLCKLLLL